MKRIKYSLGAVVVSALLLSSCSDNFFNVNTDPNNPAEGTPALMLPSGVAGSAYVLGGYYHALGSFWSQQYAQAPGASQWSEWESYNLTEDDFDRQFRTLYTGALYDYQYIRNDAAKSKNWSYYTISTLMQAYTFQVLADLYDQIPFSDALKETVTLKPKYDNGQTIYDSLLVRIDDAMLKDVSAKTSDDPGSSDVIFGGDMENWQEFANTLKLKIYLRYVNKDSTKYENEIAALLNENNFLNVDAVFSSFKSEETGYNPFYNTFLHTLGGNVVANSTMMNFLTDNADPRIEKIFDRSSTGDVLLGVATGESKDLSGTTSNNYSVPSIAKINPVYFFTKEEVYFLIAEAHERYGNPSSAKKAYEDGVKASFESLDLDTANVSLYPYNGLKSIIEQKWVASANKRAIEAFFDYNRTGYPNFLTTSITSVLNGNDKPKRLFFPSSERKTNANTPKKVALNVKVWWGK